MSDLMTLADIAEMHHCSVHTARSRVIKTDGFPPKVPGCTKRMPLWIRAQVTAFVHREPVPAATPGSYQVLGPAAHLYRHFDANGILLYVGISTATMRRLSEHRNGSAWFWSIARIEIERYPSVREAREAEKAAIRNERPLFNTDYSAVVTKAVRPE